MPRRRDDEPPFPPLWVTRFFAYGLSIAAMPVLFLWLVGENFDEELRDRRLLASGLYFAALIPAWLAYIWTGQGHFNHATAAFVLAVGLFVASLFVTPY